MATCKVTSRPLAPHRRGEEETAGEEEAHRGAGGCQEGCQEACQQAGEEGCQGGREEARSQSQAEPQARRE